MLEEGFNLKKINGEFNNDVELKLTGKLTQHQQKVVHPDKDGPLILNKRMYPKRSEPDPNITTYSNRCVECGCHLGKKELIKHYKRCGVCWERKERIKWSDLIPQLDKPDHVLQEGFLDLT